MHQNCYSRPMKFCGSANFEIREMQMVVFSEPVDGEVHENKGEILLEVKGKNLKMDWKKLIILAVVFHVYLILGAGIFHYLEKGQEEDTRLKVRQLKEEVLSNFSCIDNDTLERIIEVVVMAADNGISPVGNVTSPSNWDFSSAFFFSGITVTTIGYGHISPTTRTGQTFCMIFALIGIPACGIMLTAIGEKLSNLTEMAEKPFRSKLKKKWQRVVFHLLIIGGSMFVFFITIPAVIFQYIEDWSLHQAWYYCFITLTTIGFGDFVVDQNPEIDYPTLYVVMVYFWIIFGLAYLALIIQQIGKILASTGKVVQERVSTTVSSVATASMATGRVVHDKVSKQISQLKDTMNFSDSSDSENEEQNGKQKKLKKKPSKRVTKMEKETPGIQITIEEEQLSGEFVVTDLNEKTNGQLVVECQDKAETDSTTSAISVAHDNEVELEEVKT